jgi:hypothetical protein
MPRINLHSLVCVAQFKCLHNTYGASVPYGHWPRRIAAKGGKPKSNADPQDSRTGDVLEEQKESGSFLIIGGVENW